jgi:hypothetical protein
MDSPAAPDVKKVPEEVPVTKVPELPSLPVKADKPKREFDRPYGVYPDEVQVLDVSRWHRVS